MRERPVRRTGSMADAVSLPRERAVPTSRAAPKNFRRVMVMVVLHRLGSWQLCQKTCTISNASRSRNRKNSGTALAGGHCLNSCEFSCMDQLNGGQTPMAEITSCSSCKVKLQLPESVLGLEVKCLQCGPLFRAHPPAIQANHHL